MKDEIRLNNKIYKIIKNEKEAFDKDITALKLTDYFNEFDYIVGDWAYEKLRLKGFNKKSNKNFKENNNYEKVEEYIKKYCAYGCRWFVLEKIKD